MRIVYLDCFSGISGDMTLGALLGLGADEQEFRRQLALLGVGGYELTIARRKVEGLMSVDVDVLLTEVDTDTDATSRTSMKSMLPAAFLHA